MINIIRLNSIKKKHYQTLKNFLEFLLFSQKKKILDELLFCQLDIHVG